MTLTTCLFVAVVMVISAQADHFQFQPFNPFQFVNQFAPAPFFPFNNFVVPPPQQPFVPNFANMYTQFGKANGVTNGGGAFQSSSFGFGGDKFENNVYTSYTGPDGKTITKMYTNKNGVETEKEINGKSKVSGNGLGQVWHTSSSYGFEDGKFKETVISYENGPDGPVAKLYKNEDGVEQEKEIKL